MRRERAQRLNLPQELMQVLKKMKLQTQSCCKEHQWRQPASFTGGCNPLTCPKSFSFSIMVLVIYASILFMILLIFCFAIFLPLSATHQSSRLLQMPVRNGSIHLNISLACSATRSPQVCQSTRRLDPQAQKRALRSQDIIEGAIEVAYQEVGQSYRLVQKLLQISGGNASLTAAASDCEYLLRRASGWFNKCHHAPLATGIKDIQAWMSAVLTYVNDCRSALSYVNTTRYLGQMMEQIENVTTLTSIALSMVDAYDTFGEDMRIWKPPNRRASMASALKWQDILSRHILQTPLRNSTPALIVSKDGQGHYSNIQAAVDAAPDYADERFIIYIKEGVYNEIVRINENKTFLAFVGDGMYKTIITGSKNVQMPGVTTYASATVAVDGDDFMACDITIENTANPNSHQAVALRVDSDHATFYNCSFRGHQDTLYAHALRQFYRDCKIEGTIDFIFGNSATVFENCKILIRPGRPQASKSTITAQGRTDPAEITAFIFQNCTVKGTHKYMKGFYINPKKHKAYLGRPWKAFSRTIYIQTYLDVLIRPEGWLPWRGTFALDTLFFGEYKNYGPGANITGRVPWSSQISMADAIYFTVLNFIQGNKWLPSTGVPFMRPFDLYKQEL